MKCLEKEEKESRSPLTDRELGHNNRWKNSPVGTGGELVCGREPQLLTMEGMRRSDYAEDQCLSRFICMSVFAES